ncbi:MAG: LPS assembly protein LptD [Campylobacterota bacterium]|nr:LPS assembly protein LptD [Campylobacterota bacterium]
MYRFTLFLLLLPIALFSIELSDEVEVYAMNVDSNTTHINAKNSVLVLYQNHEMSASRATYNKESGELELFGNIQASQGEDFVGLGEYVRINISKKSRTFKPFYMLDKPSQLWVTSKLAKGEDRDFEISSGVMSSCDPTDPLWLMKFSSSEYNQDDKWLNIYNVRLYFYDIPIFYTPYFGFSLDTTRRSGLLYPAVGISANEGFFYEQPIYIAPHDNWDLELRPQIRTERGYGVYGTFRFIDSPVSKGEIDFGLFKEYDHYAKKYNLANTTHQGITVKYQNSDFIKQWFNIDLDGQSGLGVDLNLMNDVDYINLSQNDSLNTVTASQTLSRINMFYSTDKNYIGTYFKYYTDLEYKSNSNTIQNLPVIQYHHYLDTLLDEHLLYDVDIQFNNLDRADGIKAQQSQITVPLTIQTSFFDDFLNLSYTANLFARHIGFNGTPNEYQSDTNFNAGNFARNYNVFNANSQLSRGYENFNHILMFDVKYINGGGSYRSGYYKNNLEYCNENPNADNGCEYYGLSDIENQTKLEIAQYFYNKQGRQLLYQRLSQNFSYSKLSNRLQELENEIELMVTESISIYNDIYYNHQRNLITKSISTVNYTTTVFNFGLSHYFENYLESKSDAIGSTLSYQYDKNYKINATLDYDIHESVKKRFSLGFIYSKRCWDFGIEYVENNRPILTNNLTNSVYDKYIYFKIVLKPLGGFDNLSYQISESK